MVREPCRTRAALKDSKHSKNREKKTPDLAQYSRSEREKKRNLEQRTIHS